MTNPAHNRTMEQVKKSMSPTQRTWRKFFTGPVGWLTMGIMVLIALVGIFGPMIVPYPPSYGTALPLQRPSGEHWFGTDSLGREVLHQVVWGTRISLIVALCSGLMAVAIGTIVGIASAYFKGFDAVAATIVDVFLALPILPLMIVVTAMVGPSITTLILVLGFFSWPEISRIMRSNALTVVHQPFVDSAKAIGASSIRIMWKEVVPMVSPLLIVNALMNGARAVIGEASLAFLGLGDPSTWSWGRILHEAQRDAVLVYAWWQTLFPSLMILLLVLSATIIGMRYNDSREVKLSGVWP